MIRYAHPFVPAALMAALVFSDAFGVNLQTQDFLFVSTHRRPVQVESDDKVAYVLTEGGVLLYDYRRKLWVDNIGAGRNIKDIAYNASKSQLLMQLADNTVLEYNPSFRRVSQTSTPFNKTATGTPGGDLTGLSLGSDFFFLGDAVRDSYNRRAPVNTSRIFDYDNLWLLTAGHGAFLGSARRKELAHNAFGLYDSSVTAVYSDGKTLWFGGAKSDGALVRASLELAGWRSFLAQQDYQFPDGSIRDIVAWRGYIWLATAKGVVRHDPGTGRFQVYRRMLGSTDLQINRLHVHQDRLYAGTERGIASLSDLGGQFTGNEIPLSSAPSVLDFHSRGGDLWAATEYGLLVLRPNGWRSFKDVTREDVPEGTSVRVTTVGFYDSSLYWAGEDRLYAKARHQEPRTVFTQDGIFRITIVGNILYAGSPTGVRAYNLKNKLWVDFQLQNGIPGTKVQTFAVTPDHLWVGTDLGVMRIRVRPYLP
ncbi:MAG: histidine kinase [Fibrobacteria bacterium]|nr:histidine kinase [Fibrobacteria bacterium]